MKKKALIINLVLVLLLCSTFTPAFARQTKDTELKAKTGGNPKNAYIFGSFFEKRSSYGVAFSYVKLRIEDINTHQGYTIGFGISKELKMYQIPPGVYRIDSFWIKIYRLSEGEIVTADLKLEEDPRLYQNFEVQSGDLLYMGDYSIVKPIENQTRASKITRESNTAAVTGYIEKHHLKSLNLISLSETTVQLEPVTFSENNQSNPNAYIAGRFCTEGSAYLKTKIINLWTKEELKIDYAKSSAVRLFPIQPGEYIIDLDLGDQKDGNENVLMPFSWLLPFVVKPGEVMYLGTYLLNEKVDYGALAYSGYYLNDFTGSIQDINSLLSNSGDFKICSIGSEH